MNENQVHRVRAHYRGLCALIDRWFGRLMETGEELGLLENSIVVFLSDHGTMMGEQGQLHKGPSRLRWQCTQVPLIIRHPDVEGYGGSVVGAFVQHQDLMPHPVGSDGDRRPGSMPGRRPPVVRQGRDGRRPGKRRHPRSETTPVCAAGTGTIRRPG